MNPSTCPHCAAPLTPEMSPDASQGIGINFCPRCGKKLHEPPPSASLAAQAIVYGVSFFLPPLGLWYAWKYLKHGGETEKKIGIAAIVLTVIALALTIWTAQLVLNGVNQSVENLDLNNLNF